MSLRIINCRLFKNKLLFDKLSRILEVILSAMNSFLSPGEIITLRTMHRKSREKRICDKIKAILSLNSGYTYEQIAEILLLDDSTIRRWFVRFEEDGIDGLLADNYVGGASNLTDGQQKALFGHLENNVYLAAKDICAFVLKKFKVDYTVKGMTCLLHNMGFCYKKPKHIPGKANFEAQLEFIDNYNKLKKKKQKGDKIYFMDGVWIFR